MECVNDGEESSGPDQAMVVQGISYHHLIRTPLQDPICPRRQRALREDHALAAREGIDRRLQTPGGSGQRLLERNTVALIQYSHAEGMYGSIPM